MSVRGWQLRIIIVNNSHKMRYTQSKLPVGKSTMHGTKPVDLVSVAHTGFYSIVPSLALANKPASAMLTVKDCTVHGIVHQFLN